MRILLINPSFNIAKAKYDSSISVGLLCLASYLDKRSVSVKIIDAARQINWQEILNKELPGTEVVGLSVMTTQLPSASQISRQIKDNYPQIKIIWGGIHPSFFPRETIRSSLVDFVVIGEGEQTLDEFLIEMAQSRNFNQVKGLAFKDKGEIILTEKRPLLPMDEIPLPHWHLMPQEILSRLELVPTHTSRGCPHRCSFCLNAITQNRWRQRSPEQVLEDLKIIKNHPDLKDKKIRFWDENFFVNFDRAKQIIRGIINSGLAVSWETTMRVDYCSHPRLDDNFFVELKKSGCYLLSFGAESGSPDILKKIDKDITREQILFSAQKCLSHNIIPQYSFMVGLPGEKYQDIKKTLNLIDKLLKLDKTRVQILGPQAFRPYPGSKLYEECLDAGWQAPKTLEDWSWAVKDELNFLTPYHFPWVDNPALVDSLEAYARFGAQSWLSALNSTVKANQLLKFFFILLCKLRWKLRFFVFPWEIKLAKKFISR